MPARITEILDAIPGAWQRTQEGLAQAARGEGTPLDELAWVAQVFVTPQARRDVDEAISTLNLPEDTWARIARSLRALETFPLAGVELSENWPPARFVLGPWPWMILLYSYEESSNRVYVVAMYDGRSAHKTAEVGRGLVQRRGSPGARVSVVCGGGSPLRQTRPASAGLVVSRT